MRNVRKYRFFVVVTSSAYRYSGVQILQNFEHMYTRTCCITGMVWH